MNAKIPLCFLIIFSIWVGLFAPIIYLPLFRRQFFQYMTLPSTFFQRSPRALSQLTVLGDSDRS